MLDTSVSLLNGLLKKLLIKLLISLSKGLPVGLLKLRCAESGILLYLPGLEQSDCLKSVLPKILSKELKLIFLVLPIKTQNWLLLGGALLATILTIVLVCWLAVFWY